VSMKSASFHFVQYSLRDPRPWSLFVSRETRPSSSGVSKKLGRAAALPKWSARAELGRDAALAGAVVADCVPDLIICLILRVPDLAGTEVLAGAAALVGAGVFSGAEVFEAGCSGAVGVAWPTEAGADQSGSPALPGLCLYLCRRSCRLRRHHQQSRHRW
jgi:hypothetical protein